MLQSRPLTRLETNELVSISDADLGRMSTRVPMVTLLTGILSLVYPVNIMLIWFILVLITEYFGYKSQKHISYANLNNLPISTNYRLYYFIVSWLETICFATLAAVLSVQEGQIPHFIPYLIVLCSSFYVATSTYQNARLMLGHLACYSLALIFVAVWDILVTFPDTQLFIWTQLFIALLVVYFLADSYLVFHNIDVERRERSAEIDKARELAEELTQQKSDLLSTLSHELRTPLNGILGFSKILQRTKLSPKQKEYIDLISRSGKNLHFLLSNILDSETLEDDRFQLHPVETDVPKFLDRTLKIFETDAEEKGIGLYLEIDQDFPDKIMIDKTRLGQCISNLLSNAVRYTEAGSVTLTAKVEDPDNPVLTLTVHDTGIGIPADQTKAIFEKFGQSRSNKKNSSGTGLGLWLVRSISHAMNGRISLVETSPKGSVFRLEFALNAEDILNAKMVDLKNLKILHIEDTQTNLMLIRHILEGHGVVVTEATTGNQALGILEKSDFDAILCDLLLPDCDGIDLHKKICSLANSNADIPVIAITAQPEKLKKRNLKHDFSDVLAKPVDQMLLITKLAKLTAK